MNNQIKERGIIFNGEMVKAILDGRKTQTRRIMKVQPEYDQLGLRFITDSSDPSKIGKYVWTESNATGHIQRSKPFKCPFGQVGDRLWVRETFATLGNEDGHPIDWDNNLVSKRKDSAKVYRASCHQKPNNYGLWTVPDKDSDFEGPWTPSIHMPRWASRITLEITDIRVERLRSMTEDDARAEGVIAASGPLEVGLAFREIWDSIYGQESWQSNPFVWVVEFKRVEAAWLI